MGLGSCRVLLEHPEVLPTFAVRDLCPSAPLLANLGAVQLNVGVDVTGCRRIVDLLGADALVLHLNPLQEALQPEGDTRFAGLLKRIERLCATLGVAVIVKEVGWGIAPDLVVALFEAGATAVDLAGAGGTSWSEVERHRIADPVRARVAAAGAETLDAAVTEIVDTLRIAMFCAGASDLGGLSRTGRVVSRGPLDLTAWTATP
jgi:isopentenyl-diphosphate delta-isomerase